ncbi:MAG: outer membrane protein assembly factor BamC [Vibrio sp.]|uniref:outer membrane protein assembly factor BamC n=1 Tax=Vibrio sp. TaxID=678 RepID=UPI003A8360A7
MKFTRQLVISSLAVLVLSACSNSTHRRQAKDDFTYLETKSFSEWQLTEGAAPEFYPNFEIPQGNYHGGVGSAVDVRPPQQVLELIPGARAERQKGEISLWMVRKEEADKVWDTVLKVIAERKIKTVSQTSDRVETDWVSWVTEDEDVELGARYQVIRVEANNRYGFKVSLIDWREDGKQMPVSTTNKERYNALMTNLVTTRYDLDAREEAARKAQELVKQIPISMGADRSGLPVIIARSPYDVLWPRLPNILPRMGFTIEERSQSQGTVKAKYAAPDDDFWQEIGVQPIELKSGTYTFLFGDLGNRTSINVTDSSGKPVEEELLKDMVPVLAAVIDKK